MIKVAMSLRQSLDQLKDFFCVAELDNVSQGFITFLYPVLGFAD